jgi:hypothetical protein
MTLRRKYAEILSGIVPAGAVGLSLLLGSAATGSAREHPAGSQPPTSGSAGVSERLAAIREAVSDIAGSDSGAAKPADDNLRLAWGNWWHNWGWRPWGWGWPNWNNWRNWHNWPNFWRNW